MQIAVQIALSFAKVARHDFPREWPSLFQDLLARQDGGDLLLQRRVYLVLHHVLKELSSKRLTADQKNFAEVMPIAFPPRPRGNQSSTVLSSFTLRSQLAGYSLLLGTIAG